MKTSEGGRGFMLFYRSFAVPRTEDTRVPRLPTKRGSFRCQLYVFLILPALLGGCASTRHQRSQSHPFFLTGEGLDTHGRKTWFDRFIETDPGGVAVVIAADYQERPPRKIAVLPFVDRGTGSYLLNKIPVKTRDQEDLNRWSWTHANRVRRAFAGELATREFLIVPVLLVDAVGQSRHHRRGYAPGGSPRGARSLAGCGYGGLRRVAEL
jgi:hypothetical protein